MSDEEHVIVWQAPEIIAPEFRLYYDDKGYLICYTCEKLDGNYIVIDALTFAEGRPDVRVADGRLVRASTGSVVSKLQIELDPESGSVLCEVEDISIITETNGKYWKLRTYELR
jgi:hypothetical protein